MEGAPSPRGTRALLLCLHNHQPVGNFESVLGEACDRSYLPFLETLAFFPAIKVTLHYSGFLLRWIAEHRPALFGLLRDLVARGQVEILGGGMYEPVLSLLPERDRRGQIRELADVVGRHFGRRPRGMWLAERVWEPDRSFPFPSPGRAWNTSRWTTSTSCAGDFLPRSSTGST